MLKIVKSFFGFFKPKRGEFLLILISLLLLTSVIVPEFVRLSFLLSHFDQNPYTRMRCLWSFSPLLILGISIGAGLGTFGRTELLKELWFVLLVVLILPLCGFLLYRENLLFRPATFQSSSNADNVSFVFEGWLLCLLGTIGAWAITKSVFVCIDFASRKLKLATLSRQRLLIGISLLLFVCLTARNVLDQTGMHFGVSSWSSNPFLQFLTGVGIILFGAALPAWAISKIRGGWALLISVVYLGTIAGLSASLVSLSMQVLIALYGLCFSCIVVAMTSYRGLSRSNEVQKKTYGFWGLGTMLIALLTTAVLWNCSFSALIFGGSDRFALARQVKTFSTQRGVDSEFSIWNSSIFGSGLPQINARILFDSDADEKSLSGLKDSPHQFGFEIVNLNPSIDTSYIRSVSKWGDFVSNSVLTFQQLEDIANNAKSITIEKSRFVEAPDEKDSERSRMYGYPTVGNVWLNDMPDDEVGRFLEHIDVTQFEGRVRAGGGGPLSEFDWRQILDRSQHFAISVWERPPQNLLDEGFDPDTPSKLTLCQFGSLDRGYWNLIVNSRISISSPIPSSSDEFRLFWDAAFASRGTNWAGSVLNQVDDTTTDETLSDDFLADDFLAVSRRYHWVFEENENGQPTGLLVPMGGEQLDQVSKLVELETLSLDARWLESMKNYDDRAISTPTDISALGKLTKLKRLDLPSGLWGIDYAFLLRLPELEHLQFDVFAEGRTNVNFGYLAADCPNLKSVVLFGKPSTALAKELAKLPKLVSVKLIDINTSLMQAGQREQLQRTLGKNISLTIVPFEDDRPDVPAEFSAHVQEVREAVREKYLSDDGFVDDQAPR